MRTVHGRVALVLSVMLLTVACATTGPTTFRQFKSEAEAQLAANIMMEPHLAASLTGDAIRQRPNEAPGLVAAAVSAAPNRQGAITKAAIEAVPDQADAILKAARDAARAPIEGGTSANRR